MGGNFCNGLFVRSSIFNCTDGGLAEVNSSFQKDKKVLTLNIVYRPKISFDSIVMLHWGLANSDRDEWVQPPICLFSVNGTTPIKCSDNISCESITVPINNGSYYSCEVSMNCAHLEQKHGLIHPKLSKEGIEACEGYVADWINTEKTDWGLSFVLYATPKIESNLKSRPLEKVWIKRKDCKKGNFFISISTEIKILSFVNHIIDKDEAAKIYLKSAKSYFKPETKDMVCLPLSHANSSSLAKNYFDSMTQECFLVKIGTRHSTSLPIIWVAAINNSEDESGGKTIVLVYSSINSASFDDSKMGTNLKSNDLEVLLHFGFLRSLENRIWVSPAILAENLNLKVESISNCDNKSSEAKFEYFEDHNYWRCVLKFPQKLTSEMKGIGFVLKSIVKGPQKSQVTWIKSISNDDFIFKLPPIQRDTILIKSSEKLSTANLSIDSGSQGNTETRNNADYLQKEELFTTHIQEFESNSEYHIQEFIQKHKIDEESILVRRNYYISDKIGVASFIVATVEECCILELNICSKEVLILHWGLICNSRYGRKKGWECPPQTCFPANTIIFDEKACQTEIPCIQNISNILYYQKITIKFKKEILDNYSKFTCVFKKMNPDGSYNWYNDANRDIEFSISKINSENSHFWKGYWSDIVDKILTAEIEWGSITLMHRYNLMDEILQTWSSEFNNLCESKSYELNFKMIWCIPEIIEQISREPKESWLKTINSADYNSWYKRGEEFWIWIMIWMRFNALSILDWQRNYNTAPRLLASAAENATLTVTSKWVEWPQYRWLIRLIIQTMIRGGSRGQEVRDRILHIMHKNRIPEAHGTFYEQWHQKLHNNTTPDDVGICRSIIGYLRSSGNQDEFARILYENGLSWEKIASYDRPITTKPYLPCNTDMNSLAYDFEQYLEVLIDIHEAINLQRSFYHCCCYLPSELQDICKSIIYGNDKRFDDTRDLNILHDRLMKVNNVRIKILDCIYYQHGAKSLSDNNKHAIKEIMFLDLGLENLQGMFIQTMCTISGEHNLNHMVDEMNNFLWIMLGHDPVNKELLAICFDWFKFNKIHDSLSFLLLKSILERLHIFIGSHMDIIYKGWDPKVRFFGGSLGLEEDDNTIKNFMDEVLRSTLLATISLQIKRIDKYLLNKMETSYMQDWQYISYNPSWYSNQKLVGLVKRVNKITDNIDKESTPKILICSYISGEEDIPMNVIGILLTDSNFAPDILSHLSVRARNMNVLLAVCQNPNLILDEIDQINTDTIIEIKVTSDMRLKIEKNANLKVNFAIDAEDNRKKHSIPTKENLKLKTAGKSWIIYPEKMDSTVVGQKAINLLNLRKIITETQDSNIIKGIYVPNCVSLPFETLSKVIPKDLNKRINELLNQILNDDDSVNKTLSEICRIVENDIKPPKDLLQELYKACLTLKSGETDICDEKQINNTNIESIINNPIIKKMWSSITKVWSSVYHPRAYTNMLKIGQSLNNVYMSVVIQRLLKANYAFVLHSKNPVQKMGTDHINSEKYEEMYGELVIGLGETLVSNTCGKSLGFTAKRLKECKNYCDINMIQEVNIMCFPSKSIAMFNQDSFNSIAKKDFDKDANLDINYIFRSDSNAEDIAGFAGAGVFESFPLIQPISEYVTYLNQEIITNPLFRDRLLRSLGILAFYIQDEYKGVPQDIEGCIVPSIPIHSDLPYTIAVVQSRPQV
ncbi:pyruvate phosphate dikinase, PEP/pyruvate binding domain-containing protein [Cryptosporidium serpentis]